MTRMLRRGHCHAAVLTEALGVVYRTARGFVRRRAGLTRRRGAGVPPGVRAWCRSAGRMFLSMQSAVEAFQHRGER